MGGDVGLVGTGEAVAGGSFRARRRRRAKKNTGE
jgi:hypothetical protein